jgi:hypothetical protein
MIGAGFDDYTVMEISGHSSTRMLGRYTHPTTARKQGALETFGAYLLGQDMGRYARTCGGVEGEVDELLKKLVDGGGIEPPTSALRTQRSPS